MTHQDFDRIEREIIIDAAPDRVWQLISKPGWYIGGTDYTRSRIEQRGDLTIVHDPTNGAFAFRVVELDEPRYAAFRWHITLDVDSSSTLVEFWITHSPSGCLLRVVESGFASLSEPEADRRSRFDDHTTGWRLELELARDELIASLTHAR